MKLSRKLVPAIAMLLVSAVMLSTASFAWFSMNTTVSATDIRVQAAAMGSLIIKADSAPTADESTKETVNLMTSVTALTDATHVAADSEWATYANGLKSISAANRASGVSAETGAYTSTSYIEAVENTHYVEFVVYIAAKSSAIVASSGKTEQLSVKLAVNNGVSGGYIDAYACDFYVQKVTEKGDTVAAVGTGEGKNYSTLVHVGDATATPIYTGDIPVAFDTKKDESTPAENQGAIKVIMRVYIDGAYQKDGSYVVKNDNWKADNINLTATFTLAEVTATP